MEMARWEPARVGRDRRFGEPGTRLDAVGEAAVLDAFAAHGRPRAGAVVLASGDDAAVVRAGAGNDVVLSQDALVEGIDWRPAWIGPHDLGRRAFAVAASDLAAMGAEPLACMATLCAGGATPVEDAVALHHGLYEAAERAGCPLVGGDISDTAGPLVIDVTVVGSVPEGTALRRDAAQAGDVVIVTGTLGRAAAGLLRLVGEERSTGGGLDELWMDALLNPAPRLAEGQALRALGARCAGDLSDGLLADAARTAAASKLGMELWASALPVDPELRIDHGGRWLELAVAGGEDFELLVTVSAPVWESLRRDWDPALQPMTVIGRMIGGTGVHLLDRENGTEIPHPPVSSRHYSA